MAAPASLILPDGSERQLAPEFTIGRAEDNDLTPREADVSRHHVVVTEEGDRWFLEDRGSFNGTFLNGSRIQAGVEGAAAPRRPDRPRRRERRLLGARVARSTPR